MFEVKEVYSGINKFNIYHHEFNDSELSDIISKMLFEKTALNYIFTANEDNIDSNYIDMARRFIPEVFFYREKEILDNWEQSKVIIEKMIKRNHSFYSFYAEALMAYLNYKVLNIPIFKVSKRTGEGVKELSEFIKDKVVAFSGQTGAGKSSLINFISPDFNRKEGQYSKFLNRGKHQTKEVILLPFENSFLVDTPGFSSLELQMYKENLKDYFPFFKLATSDCFFLDCMHINEPKCEIKKMLDNGLLTKEHYDNYRQIFDELVYRKDRFK